MVLKFLLVILLGVVVTLHPIWFFGIPFVQAEREAFIYRQLQVCIDDDEEESRIFLPAINESFIANCVGKPFNEKNNNN